MPDRLCTPSDLAAFMDQDLNTHMANVALEAATAIVQSLVGEPITSDYPEGSQELQLARTAALKLASGIYSGVIGAYEMAYETAKLAMDESPHWKAALRLQYDRRTQLISSSQ